MKRALDRFPTGLRHAPRAARLRCDSCVTTFPEIEHLEPVRQIVADAEGFTIASRPDHIVVCYVYASPEVFPEITSCRMPCGASAAG